MEVTKKRNLAEGSLRDEDGARMSNTRMAQRERAIPNSTIKNNLRNIIECCNNTHQGARHVPANKRSLALRTSVTVVMLLVFSGCCVILQPGCNFEPCKVLSIFVEKFEHFLVIELLRTSLRKVIWEEGGVAAKVYMYAIKSLLVTIARPIFAPKSTLSRGPIPKPHYLPHPCTPSDLRRQTASGSDPPFFHNALDGPTHGQTDRQTDRSSTGKFDHCRPLRL